MESEENFLLYDDDDENTIAFIRNYLPQELKDKFSDKELCYFLDLLVGYYIDSGILESDPDEEGYVNIDLEHVAEYIVQQAKIEKAMDYEPEEILLVVQAEMEYGNSLGEVD